jgi:hypothetical protein
MENFVIRVRTDTLVVSDRATALWIVCADSPEEALEIVRGRIASGCEAEMTDHRLQPDTVKKLGLAKGQAWHL